MKTFSVMMVAMMFSFCAVVCGGEEATPQDASSYTKTLLENPDFKTVFDAHQTASDKITKDYEKVLSSEKEKATSKGDLDKVEKIDKELSETNKNVGEGWLNTSKADWGKTGTLSVAAKKYNSDIKKENAAFVKALEKLVVTLTKKNEMVTAKDIKKYIEVLKVEEVKRMIVGKWRYNVGSINSFDEDGTVSQDHTVGKWKIDGGKMVVSWSTGLEYIFNLPVKVENWEMKDSGGHKFTATKIE